MYWQEAGEGSNVMSDDPPPVFVISVLDLPLATGVGWSSEAVVNPLWLWSLSAADSEVVEEKLKPVKD